MLLTSRYRFIAEAESYIDRQLEDYVALENDKMSLIMSSLLAQSSRGYRGSNSQEHGRRLSVIPSVVQRRSQSMSVHEDDTEIAFQRRVSLRLQTNTANPALRALQLAVNQSATALKETWMLWAYFTNLSQSQVGESALHRGARAGEVECEEDDDHPPPLSPRRSRIVTESIHDHVVTTRLVELFDSEVATLKQVLEMMQGGKEVIFT